MGVTDTNRAESIWVHEQNLLAAAIAYAHANMRIRSLNMRKGARRTDRNASRSSATDSYDASKGTAVRQPLLLQLLLLFPQKELGSATGPRDATGTSCENRHASPYAHAPPVDHSRHTPRRFLLLPIFIRTNAIVHQSVARPVAKTTISIVVYLRQGQCAKMHIVLVAAMLANVSYRDE